LSLGLIEGSETCSSPKQSRRGHLKELSVGKFFSAERNVKYRPNDKVLEVWRLTRVIAVMGGKGGIGKTTLVSNLGAALAGFGCNVLAVDSNLTTPNLGIHLGIPLYPKTMHDVLKGKANITEAIYRHPSGLRVIPAGLSLDDLNGADPKDLPTALLDVLGIVDIMLLDASAGLGREAVAALEAADEVMILTTPDTPSVTDALKASKLAQHVGAKPTGIIVNRILGKQYEMTRQSIRGMLELPIIAEIPEDHNVPASIAARTPLVNYMPRSPASREIMRLAAGIAGVELPKPWWHKLFYGV
jgi:septum site-determining protein MinD